MRISTVLVVCAVLSGCADSEQGGANLPIQNVGLQALGGMSGTPPLGEGTAPLGGDGGDGTPVITGVGTAVGGGTYPGAVRWHGGQWIVPYVGRPGSTVANVTCDVIPNATSTDLMELVGSGGVIGALTVPAASGISIRAWIVPSVGHVIADGEQLMLRHTPRDSTTGAWTSAAQDLTILGCAVNATPPGVTVLLTGINAVGTNQNAIYTPNSTYITSHGPVQFLTSLPFHVGDRFSSVSFTLVGSGTQTAIGSVRVSHGSGQNATLGTMTISGVPATLSKFTIAVPSTTLVSDDGVALVVDVQQTDVSMGSVSYTRFPSN